MLGWDYLEDIYGEDIIAENWNVDTRFMFSFRGGAKGKDPTSVKCARAGVGLVPGLGEVGDAPGAAASSQRPQTVMPVPRRGVGGPVPRRGGGGPVPRRGVLELQRELEGPRRGFAVGSGRQHRAGVPVHLHTNRQ